MNRPLNGCCLNEHINGKDVAQEMQTDATTWACGTASAAVPYSTSSRMVAPACCWAKSWITARALRGRGEWVSQICWMIFGQSFACAGGQPRREVRKRSVSLCVTSCVSNSHLVSPRPVGFSVCVLGGRTCVAHRAQRRIDAVIV